MLSLFEVAYEHSIFQKLFHLGIDTLLFPEVDREASELTNAHQRKIEAAKDIEDEVEKTKEDLSQIKDDIKATSKVELIQFVHDFSQTDAFSLIEKLISFD